MIKLRKMQEQKQQQAAQQQSGDAAAAPAAGGAGVFSLKKEGATKAKPTVSAAELRAQKG